MPETATYHGHKPPGQWDEAYWKDHVYQGRSLMEMTVRAVLIGSGIGVLLVAINVYMGLKTGFGEGGSIIGASGIAGASLVGMLVALLIWLGLL